MIIDLHTHTCRYSPCSRFTPHSQVEAAIESGLDGIVITEHGVIWSEDEVAELRKEFPNFTILRGVEITVASGDDFLVYGVLEPELFYQRMPARELLDKAAEKGGFVALAHAYRYSDDVAPEVYDGLLDAVEVMSSNIRRYSRDRIRQLANELQVPVIAGSDGHAPATIGMFATNFEADITNERELVEALRSRQYTLHKNQAKIDAKNREIEETVANVKRLLGNGLTPEEIRQRFGISQTLIRAVSRGLDARV